MEKLTIATRGSRLALWQAEFIRDQITKRYPQLPVELRIIKTKGDIITDVPLAKVGGKGLFVKEIEEALLDGTADIAVHSMKDVPADLPPGLCIGVIPARADYSDTLLSWKFSGLAGLPANARIGTSSLRRQAQLKALRPDLSIINLRGNLDTRLQKLQDGGYDAIIVATAGLTRLGLTAPHAQRLEPPDFYPAIAQGALGIEFLENRRGLAELLQFLDDPASRSCVEAERAFLFGLDGGCQVPIAGLAKLENNRLELCGIVCDLTGRKILRRRTGEIEQKQKIGSMLAKEVLAAGGKEILSRLHANHLSNLSKKQ